MQQMQQLHETLDALLHYAPNVPEDDAMDQDGQEDWEDVDR
jgi:hypothetical protein